MPSDSILTTTCPQPQSPFLRPTRAIQPRRRRIGGGVVAVVGIVYLLHVEVAALQMNFRGAWWGKCLAPPEWQLPCVDWRDKEAAAQFLARQFIFLKRYRNHAFSKMKLLHG